MRGALLLDDVMYIINRTRNDVEMKKRELKEQTKGILAGQTVLGEMRKNLRDSQSQVDQLLESKKAAVTGYYCFNYTCVPALAVL